MLHRTLLCSLPFLSSACHVRPESLLPAGATARVDRHSEFLRGAPASFVVLGDATSFAWPTLLQEMLDAHAQQHGLYRVRNGAVEDGEIGAWTWKSESADGPLAVLKAEVASLRAQLRSGVSAPTTALCLLTLRGLGDDRGPVKSAHDMVGAEMGADALERLALELHAAGVEHVVFATPLYAADAEPELGLEHVALERLLARGHAFVEAGPDVFRASRRYFPDAYEPDREHPNEFGTKLVAEEWYRWLAGPEAREDVVERLYSTDYDVEALEAAYARKRGATVGP